MNADDKAFDPTKIDTKGETFGHGETGRALFWLALIFTTFQLITAAYSPLSSLVVRSIHVGFLLAMIFALQATRNTQNWGLAVLNWALAALSFTLSLYHWGFEGALVQRSGDPNMADLVVGTIFVLLVFEAARRLMGWALPAICAAFTLYVLFGDLLPSPLNHRGYDYEQLIGQFYLGTEGIFGTPTYVSSSYIFLFILFGAFLEQAGMIRLFTDIAMGTVGHQRGGPAKVAVIASGLMGTINGSGVANVVTTGQFTIPLMKRFGYRPEFAGAVEATASMGGQIMPPVMGAVAFIMAETLNISYAEVCKAAAIPAILYYVTAFWMVHLEAAKNHLDGLPKDQCPSALMAFKRQWFLVIPLAVLVYLLLFGFTPMFAGTIGLAATAIVILGNPLSARLPDMVARVIFWVLLALLCSSFLTYGIDAILLIIAVMVGGVGMIKGARETLRVCVQALVEGARAAVPVGIACALVGTIVGTLTLTGLAGTVTNGIIALAGGSLFLTLLLAMVASLILGMGIPTIPNYIITSSLVAPILLQMGVPLIVSHMFVFYFGIMADLTPPVALAAFAAATIAKSSFMKTGFTAVKIAIAGFVVPYMAVYDNALMLQTDDLGAIAYVVVKALIAILLWGSAAVGHLMIPMGWIERAVATAAAFSLVLAIPLTDEIGFGLGAALILWHVWRARNAAKPLQA